MTSQMDFLSPSVNFSLMNNYFPLFTIKLTLLTNQIAICKNYTSGNEF